MSVLNNSEKTGGLLLKALQNGTADEITWTEVTVGDIVITVATDALRSTLNGVAGVRLPVSHSETIEICRSRDWIAPTQAMCDAMFASAKSQLNYVPLVRTAADAKKMNTVGFTTHFHEGVIKQLTSKPRGPGDLAMGAWKHWILHPRIKERGAVTYGFWDLSKKPPKPVQAVSAMHDAFLYDYSQLLQPVKRYARRVATGEKVDLIEYIIKCDKVPEESVRAFDKGAGSGGLIASFAEEGVDIVEALVGADVEVVPADGWETRGRTGFAPVGIMLHHTAGPRSGDAPLLDVCLNGRPDLAGPLCNIYLSRSGKAHVLAANTANHAGMGAREVLELVKRGEDVTGNAVSNDLKDSVGGNIYFYGIEIENSGAAGDPYPPAQMEALAKNCAALCVVHRWSPSRVIHHRQWTARKIDMSFRGDVPGMVAQYMDSNSIHFGEGEDPSEPMFEPEGEGGVAMSGPGDETDVLESSD